jgi:lipoprotein-anchoring transpeptidase ErfK/SrfK
MTRTPIPTRRPRLVLALLLAALVSLGAACGSGGSAAPDVSLAVAGVVSGETTVARPDGDTPVYASPDAAEPDQVLPGVTEFGSPLALVVLDRGTSGWLHVQLPTRPNGSTGWIEADGVELRTVTTAITVDLDARRLVVTDGGTPVLETTAAVGAPGTPTPTGTFFVTDMLSTGEDGGSYGPFALGLSAHSEVLTEFAGGDGQVGIHGTNQPDSIGAAVSNGCVRVPNDLALQLRGLVSLGTPVTVG